MNRCIRCLFVLLACIPIPAFAASYDIAPSSATVRVGDTVSLRVSAASDSSLNALSGTLSFPSDPLAVTGVSKTGSIVTLWVQDPSFSNKDGTVSWSGVVPNPGYIGDAGRVLTVTFKALRTGTATVAVNDGSILANDGEGTELYKSSGTATITILPRGEAPASAAPATPVLDATPPEWVLLTFPEGTTTAIARLKTVFEARDAGGMKEYRMYIDDHLTVVLSAAKGRQSYQLPEMLPGTHILAIGAVDTSDNVATSSATFTILSEVSARIALNITELVLLLLLGIFIGILLGWLLWMLSFRRHVRRRANPRLGYTYAALHEKFEGVKTVLEKELLALEREHGRRGLTAEESRLLKSMSKILDLTEHKLEHSIESAITT
jgi:hypothetical protein